MSTARVERRLAAILAADVVGYSRLMEKDEAGTFARLKQLRHELIEPMLQQHGGRFVDLKGDGAIVEFQSVMAAVEAAVAVQRAMLDRDPELPEDRRIRYRIGINLGDVIVDGQNIFGDGINVAARIESLCEPGGIWLSRSVYNQVKGKLDVGFTATGLHQVKNISEAVETFRVALDGVAPIAPAAARVGQLQGWGLTGAAALFALIILGGVWHFWLAETSLAKPSIAVLPFANLGGDDATGRLADGVTEDIITDLARFREFDVIARNSTGVYEGKPVDVRQVAKDLDVRYVLEGSIQRQGEQVRVTAQFLDAATGGHLWSERWDRPAADLFAIQTEIGEQVAAKLGGWGLVGTAEREIARRARPRDLTAYELLLQAEDVFQANTKAATEATIQQLQRAVAKDPAFARAWVFLAYALDYTTSFGADLATAEKSALEAAERAVALIRLMPRARGIGRDHRYHGRSPARLPSSRRPWSSIRGRRIPAELPAWAASWGEAERGAELADRVLRLNPNYPTWAGNRLRSAYFSAGRYEDALRMVERQPAQSRTRFGWIDRAASYAALGRTAEARAAVDDALARYPHLSVEWVISEPSFSEADRQRYGDLLSKAGFVLCASRKIWPDWKSPCGCRSA